MTKLIYNLLAVYFNLLLPCYHFRSSLKDAEEALKLKPNYDKPLIRAANCCFETRHYERCIEYCDRILLMDTNTNVLELRKKSVSAQKLKERIKRKQELHDRKKMKNEVNLLSEILSRGYKLEGDSSK